MRTLPIKFPSILRGDINGLSQDDFGALVLSDTMFLILRSNAKSPSSSVNIPNFIFEVGVAAGRGFALILACGGDGAVCGCGLACLNSFDVTDEDELTSNCEFSLPVFFGGGVAGGRGLALAFLPRLVFVFFALADTADATSNWELGLSFLFGGGVAGGLGFSLNCLLFFDVTDEDELADNREFILPVFFGGGVAGGRGLALAVLPRLIFVFFALVDKDDVTSNWVLSLSFLFEGGVAGGLGFALDCLPFFDFADEDELADNREFAVLLLFGGGVSGGRGLALLSRLVFFAFAAKDGLVGDWELPLSVFSGDGVAGGRGLARTLLPRLVFFTFADTGEAAGTRGFALFDLFGCAVGGGMASDIIFVGSSNFADEVVRKGIFGWVFGGGVAVGRGFALFFNSFAFGAGIVGGRGFALLVWFGCGAGGGVPLARDLVICFFLFDCTGGGGGVSGSWDPDILVVFRCADEHEPVEG